MENKANNRTAVIKSVTKTMASKDGKNALSSANGRPANGTTVPNPTSTTTATTIAEQLCRMVGGRSTSHALAASISCMAMFVTSKENWRIHSGAVHDKCYASPARLW